MTSCQFNATLGGIGDFIVASAPAGHFTPENGNVTDGKTYTYYSQSYDASVPPVVTAWEAGSGAYDIATHKLKRTIIVANSNGDLLPVNFPMPPIVDVYPSPSLALEPIIPVQIIPWGHLGGLTLSAAGGTATFGVAAGMAADSTNVNMMVLASAFTKTTAAWAAGTGNGAIDTGSVVASGGYHIYLIKRLDTGVTDILFSTSATAPTLPTGYTLFRRIGWMFTDGSSQWIAFSQSGDEFLLSVGFVDFHVTAPGTSAVLRSLSVPSGIKVTAILDVICFDGGGTAGQYLFSSPDESDQSPSTNVFTFYGAGTSLSGGSGRLQIRTNTSGQIRTRADHSSGNVAMYGFTHGWIDTRGRFA